MKLVALCLAITIAVTLGCGSPSPVVGKWKPAQRFDRFHETWEPAKDAVYLELSSDGKYEGFLKGKLGRGTYKVDNSIIPHHLIFTDEKSGTTNAAFKVEGRNLTMKSYGDAGAGFPPDLEPGNAGSAYELVVFERQ